MVAEGAKTGLVTPYHASSDTRRTGVWSGRGAENLFGNRRGRWQSGESDKAMSEFSG